MARPWYAFYPADYGRDTGHLSLIEHGAYRALMDHYYATAAPLPADEQRLLRLCRAGSPAEQDAVRYVLGTFFDTGADGWHHPRIDAEIAKAADITAKCSVAARIGVARRRADAEVGADAGSDAGADAAADEQPSQSQSQSPSQQKYKSAAPGFAEFWAAYPRRESRGAARAVYARACTIAAPEVLAAAAAAYGARRAGQDAAFTKLPATWLAQECWLDDVAVAARVPDAAQAAACWDGAAASLVAEIGAAAFQAYFGRAQFTRGPPVRIGFAAPYLRDLAARKFSHSLRRAYGEFILEAA